jgi:pyruvate/2-oxoglutarate dehydrogenase complex dihydrolipoamide acyltransferase (E2) component
VSSGRMRAHSAWWLDRGIVLAACLLAGGASLYASYDALTRLATWAGWDESAAPALPLTVDVIALAAGIRYIRSHPGAPGRSTAYKGVVWSGAASIVGNTIVHVGLTPDWGSWHRIIAALVSAVPPIGLGYVVHLVGVPVVRQLPDAPAADVPAEESAPAPEPEPERTAVPAIEAEPEPTPEEEPAPEPTLLFPSPPRQRRAHARAGGTGRPTARERGLALMARYADSGDGFPSAKDMAEELGCGERMAQLIQKEWKEQSA